MSTIHRRSDFIPLATDAQRELANLEQAYGALADSQRELRSMPASMYTVSREGAEYLYWKVESSDSGTSVGRLDDEAAARLAEYRQTKASLKARIDSASHLVEARARSCRALRVSPLPDKQGELLRELDYAQLLGTDLMVVGTNCFPAYEVLSGVRFPVGNEATEDFDLAWCRGTSASVTRDLTHRPMAHGGAGLLRTQPTLLSVLRSIDSSYRINKAKQYQAINDASYEVELLAAPSCMPLPANTGFAPMYSLIEQEWLLKGRPFSCVVPTVRHKGCPLFVPDPRWMALHKLWLSRKPERNSNKRPKDLRQGNVLLDAARHFLVDSYPLDLDFVLELPDELRDIFNEWAQLRGFDPTRPAYPGTQGDPADGDVDGPTSSARATSLFRRFSPP
jgi:hypothetical protein